jgi:sugar phosphate isomerase/epimerase
VVVEPRVSSRQPETARWRLGVFGLTPPVAVADDAALEWSIREASNLNVEIIGGDHRSTFGWGTFAFDRGYWRELKAIAAASRLEIEPFVRSPFDVIGAGSTKARAALVESIRASKELGGPVLRTAYGNQTVARSRFGRADVAEHLRFLASQLREADRIAESEDVVLAIENHTDFSGQEWNTVFSEVNSERVRCAVDTGNGLTIFTDPAEDVRALARWSVSTHIKDMRIVENPRPDKGMSPQVPFGLVGCPIGEGHLDVLATVRCLISDSPLGNRLPLIVEPSWPSGATEASLPEKRNALVAANVRNLRRLLDRL